MCVFYVGEYVLWYVKYNRNQKGRGIFYELLNVYEVPNIKGEVKGGEGYICTGCVINIMRLLY